MIGRISQHQNAVSSHRVIFQFGVFSLALCASLCAAFAQTTARVVLKRDASAPANLSYQLTTGKRQDFKPAGLTADKNLVLDIPNDFLDADTTLTLIDDQGHHAARFNVGELKAQKEALEKQGNYEANLIRNGSFQSGLSGWQKLPQSADLALQTSKPQTGTAQGQALSILGGGGMTSDSGIITDPFTLTNNRSYRLRFAARADSPRTLKFQVRLKGSSQTVGLDESKAISTEWKPYEVFFTSAHPAPGNTPERVEFAYHGTGSENKVFLAGTFNSWSENADPMEWDASKKIWHKTLLLPPNTYEYKFLVDGNWTSDVAAPMKPENNRNSVKQVGLRYLVNLVLLPGTGQDRVEIADVSLQLHRMPAYAYHDVPVTGKDFHFPPPVVAAATPATSAEPTKEEGSTKLLMMLAAVAGALLVALGSLIYSVNNRRKQEMAALPATPKVSGHIAQTTAVVPAMTARQPVSALSGSTNATMTQSGERPSEPHLIGVRGTYNGYTFTLSGENNIIGRDITSAVALPQDTNVSRRHAILHAEEGEYVVTDEGSSNGTFVNGQRIPVNTPHPLKQGDEIEFGSSRFRFEV